ncbi:hypothetical protein HDU67_004798, partial [Dinochytrium kinnereticum]
MSTTSSSTSGNAPKFNLPVLTAHASEMERIHWSKQVLNRLTVKSLKKYLTVDPDVGVRPPTLM